MGDESKEASEQSTKLTISREIRFSLVHPADIGTSEGSNSWAGWPQSNVAAPYLVLRCVIEGAVDPVSGYLCDIQILDRLLRNVVIEEIIPSFDGTQTFEQILYAINQQIRSKWNISPRLVQLTLQASPYLSYEIHSEAPTMVEVTQQYEFSAAHRLNCEGLSEDDNKELFGKCNNPEGHGHNYVVEVAVTSELDDAQTATAVSLQEMNATVKRLVIDRLDHKHLNRDIDYFKTVNPSVENIAVAIYRWLEGNFGPAKLCKVRVYETPKTWAEFSG